MSQTEETTDPKQEQATNDATPEPTADEVIIVEGMKPSSALPQSKPAKYGNRKKRAGETTPAVTKISSIGTFEEEEIEMDDLPVRANAPEHLIDTRNHPSEESDGEDQERPRRSNRSRGERRGNQDRDRAPRKRRERQEPETTEVESTEAESDSDENRPARFGMVSEKPKAEASVQEFRPSRDGRVSEKRTSEKPTRARASTPAPKKKGILSKIISFFTGGDAEEEKAPQKRKSDSRGPRKRSARGPQDRERNEDGSERSRRRRRPRNRKPRPEGQAREEGENGDGEQRKRRRRPRRRNNNGQRRENAGAQGKSDAS